MELRGKGYYMWKVKDCEGGDPDAIARVAKEADLSHVMIKVADNGGTYNITNGKDMVPPVVAALKNAGIQAWGWQYIYGSNPGAEARIAVQRVNQLGLDGFVVNAEVEYKQSGKAVAARTYMRDLRNGIPNVPIALSTFRFPTYHPNFPYSEFLDKCDLNMPQVYWQAAHNPGQQLIRSVREYQNITPFRPIVPTGAAYSEHNWTPVPEEHDEFLRTAQSLNLKAANFWSWDFARKHLPHIWNRIRDYNWPSGAGGGPTKDIIDRYIDALNTRDPVAAAVLYSDNGVHVNATRTVQGHEALLAWYNVLFNQILPNGQFQLTGFSGNGNSRHLTWTANSSSGKVLNGNDTFGLKDGEKIAYHYTFFTVSPN
ncbi:MAG: nuclear transport factor 2 family protein [Chloroflexi bacterium]|nr:MAG: nuclear transport factor 2 family protein [Chloroflexota bacterium]MBL1197315.1 nuclear transport factor 2 family protein [Chloroflexota bacterium]NOH14611.1 nuclear transport factor 2 family protein [Chloroflexota bacterium]